MPRIPKFPTPLQAYYNAKYRAEGEADAAANSIDDGEYTQAIQELFNAIEQCRLAQQLRKDLP